MMVEFTQVHIMVGSFHSNMIDIGLAAVDPTAVAVIAERPQDDGITTIGFHNGEKIYVRGNYATVREKLGR